MAFTTKSDAVTLDGAAPLSSLSRCLLFDGECSFGFNPGVSQTLALQTWCQEELQICLVWWQQWKIEDLGSLL